MSLLASIEADVKQAMIDKSQEMLGVLRMLKSAIKNEEIALKKKDEGLTDQEVIFVLRREVKKRKDSIIQYEQGGRPELAENEKKEIDIIEKYLPAQMNEDDVRKVVEEVISVMGEVQPSQFGAIMGAAMAKLGGAADGSLVSKIVKETLNK